MIRKDLEHTPDYAVPPGESLQEIIDSLGMSQAELAIRTGRPLKTINELVKGRAAITPETALQLERALGVPASFWNNRERLYREALARLNEEQRLKAQVEWLDELPIAAMAKLGWIRAFKDKVSQLREVLNFFGVTSPEQWREVWSNNLEAAFRKSAAFKSDPGAVAAWLRKGILDARGIDCKPYDSAKFKDILRQVRLLTTERIEVAAPTAVRLCSEAGVAVVFVPELPKTRISGATRWLTSRKALVQLSLRYKTDDHLWFTFFHEAAHIFLHGKREVFIEGIAVESSKQELKEKEADCFAADTLIAPSAFRRLRALGGRQGLFSKVDIQHFASEIGIAPGIVVGRLQHEGLLPPSHCNDLRVTLTWAKAQ